MSRKGKGDRRADPDSVLEVAKRVLEVEGTAILALRDRIDRGFSDAVDLILSCDGKVIVSGVGKSGHIARKIASTLASTGTPSFFIHPSEGIHGDLGMATSRDIFLFISNSGETDEVVSMVPFVKRLGCTIISITGKRDSALARNSDVVIPVEVQEEACPMGLAPTASTTAVLAMGDAVAVALLERRGFTQKDFAQLHPGGVLGKKLLLTVGDLMHSGEAIPLVREDTRMREALFEITSKRLGVTGVISAEGELVGVITDGDLRRGLERWGNEMLDVQATSIMTRDPKWIQRGSLAVDALNKMQRHAITSLFVFSGPDRRRLDGIIHLHDLLKAGVV